jgi:hypothetical protein
MRGILLGYFLLRLLIGYLLMIASAFAANYAFPGNLPSGCSGSNGNYACSTLTLSYHDTVTVSSPLPATITVNGNFTTNTSYINSGGSPANLNLVVTGTLNAGYAATINANITAGAISDANGYVTFGGSLATTTGNISLGYASTVAGSVSSTSGTITIGQNNVVNGNVTSSSGTANIGYAALVVGKVATGGTIATGQNSMVSGNIAGGTGNVSIGYGATVSGAITTSSGQISFAQSSVASSCVTSTSSAAITLGYQVSVNSVCCGSACGTACVANNSTYSMPAACSGSASPSLGYFPIPVWPLNQNLTAWSDGSRYSAFNGLRMLGGVPFELQTDADGDNAFWGSNLTPWTLSGSSSLTLTLNTSLYGATKVYTLINSAWGSTNKNVGSITFNATNGDSYTVQLVEGVNVRDHYYGGFVNAVSSGTVTKNVIGSDTSGTAHLDMQTFTLPNSFATETLSSIVFISTGSSSTGLPFLAGVTVKASNLVGTTATVVPFGFNCVVSGAGALNGHLYTQLAGTAFAFDVVALKDGNSDNVADAVATTYASDVNRSVTVELVDASSGASCSSYSAISPAVSQTLTFSKSAQASELGRKSAAGMTVAKAYPNLRCRVTDASQASTVTGCSTDNFAVRPTGFDISASADGSSTVKASAGFSLTAASGVAGYNGTPKLNAAKLSAHSGAVATGTLAGSFAGADPASGSATGSSFSYSEVGLFSLAAQGIYDDTFTAVDSANGDCTSDFSNSSAGGLFGCNFGNTAATSSFGRFIPDHFDVALNMPMFAPACSTFTYVGQPVKYVTLPVATLTAKNASSATTQNYTGTYWKINPSHATYGINPSYSEATQNLTVVNSDAPSAADNGNGTGTLSFADTSSNILAVTRGNPLAPFDAEIALSFTLRDTDGVAVGNINGLANGNPVKFGAASAGQGIGFGGHKTQRWGRFNMQNAFGSEIAVLSLPLYSEYYNGSAFVLNSADNCTSLNLFSQLRLGNPSTAAGVLQAGNVAMTIAPSGTTQASLANSTLAAGNAGLSFSAPGAGNTGYVDITGNFSGLTWLLFDWDHDGAQDDSPSARASFGLYKGNTRQIYFREVY